MDSPRPEAGLDRGECCSMAWPPTLPTALTSLLAGFRTATIVYGCGDMAVTTGSYRGSLDKKAGPESYACWHPALLSIPDSGNPQGHL